MNSRDQPTRTPNRTLTYLAEGHDARSNRQLAPSGARRGGSIAAVRAVLGHLARVGSILEPIASTPGAAADRVDAVLTDLDATTTTLLHAIQDGPAGGDVIGHVPQQLRDLEARLRGEWVEELGNAPAAQLDRLTEACRLLHGAAFALQSGTVS